MMRLEQLERGSFAPASDALEGLDPIRIVSWNINRGLQLNEILAFLTDASADLILLQEVDVNARRTHRRNIAQEIAQTLQMNYVFGCEFEELTQGGHNLPAYHGQATLSRLPLSTSRILRFHMQSGFWRPRWFIPKIQKAQRRVGARMALITQINWAERPLIVYNLHLESRGDNALRRSQLTQVLEDARQYVSETPVVIAGDFNLDLSRQPATSIISDARFDNPFNNGKVRPTTARSHWGHGRTIDWILTGGPLAFVGTELHDSVSASDHYPMSLTLLPKIVSSPSFVR